MTGKYSTKKKRQHSAKKKTKLINKFTETAICKPALEIEAEVFPFTLAVFAFTIKLNPLFFAHLCSLTAHLCSLELINCLFVPVKAH